MQNQNAKWIGLLIGGGFLIVACSKVSWDAFYVALISIKLNWTILAVICLFVSMYLRALRWLKITGLPLSKMSEVWDASCVGYFGTAVYPARAGDILKILRLKETTQIEAGHAIGSALVDRILDGLALLVLLLMTLILKVSNMQSMHALWGIAFLFLMVAICGIFFILFGHRLSGIFEWAAVKWRLGKRFNSWFCQCLAGLQILRSPILVLSIFSLQVLISIADIAAISLLFNAFSWQLPWTASLVALVYLAAMISLPSSPGYVGVYQIATLIALTPYGVDESAAVAYGTVLQVLSLSLFIGVGVWAYKHNPKSTVQTCNKSVTNLDRIA